jgi:hypothetical protein
MAVAPPTPSPTDFVIPPWVQIGGAAALALLSYFTSYKGGHVEDMLTDMARDLKLVLQKLDEISGKISNVLAKIKELPDRMRQILKEQELSEHNTKVKALLLRYDQELPRDPKNPLVTREVERIYHDLANTTAVLQVLSREGDIQLAPLASMMVPLCLLLEVALLFRLGRDAHDLREMTIERYRLWLSDLLDNKHPNNIAAALQDADEKLAASERASKYGILQPAWMFCDSRQAICGVEHRIGSSDVDEDGKSEAERLHETWWSLYAVILLTHQDINGADTWKLGGSENLETEWYARVAGTFQWLGPSPPWTINVDFYDGGSLYAYRGQETAQRKQDILHSSAWLTFITKSWPKSIEDLSMYNCALVRQKFVSDVYHSVSAAAQTIKKVSDNKVLLKGA